MNSCPKCGSIRISGPKYCKHIFGYESLRYSCSQCGYEKDEPTRDASEREMPLAGLKSISGWRE